MDTTEIIDIIYENIEAKDVQSINKLVDYYGNKNKTIFIAFLINTYAQKYISNNVWFLLEIMKLLDESDKSKNRADAFKAACILLAVTDQKTVNLLNYNKDELIKDIERIFYKTQKEYADLVDLKDYLTNDIYLLVNVLYQNIAYGYDIHDCFSIAKYIISKKNKDLFLINTKEISDGIDILFIIIIRYIESNRISPDIKNYVSTCKRMYYFNFRQKDKMGRINLLFYALFVLLQRKVGYQEMQYKNLNTKLDKNTTCQYLFVLINYDTNLINQVQNDKTIIKKREKKIINITNPESQFTSCVDIIKD